MSECFKQPRPKKERNRMNRRGPVSKRRLAVVAELKKRAAAEGWIDRCEICPILWEHGLIDDPSCYGDLTFAHSMKHRPKDSPLDYEVARACEARHFYLLDELPPKIATTIVREAIARREQ